MAARFGKESAKETLAVQHSLIGKGGGSGQAEMELINVTYPSLKWNRSGVPLSLSLTKFLKVEPVPTRND